MQAKIQQVRAKVQECIAKAEVKFGIKMPNVDVRFDLTGRAAGMACYRYGTFYLRFNVKHMQLGGQTWEHLLNDTVPHEVAHTVCQAFPQFGRNHDAGWKRMCLALGGNGRRCYSEEDAPEAVAANRPYVYITTTGHEIRVTKVMHTKIQKGASYVARGKGNLNRSCSYNYMTAPAVAASKKPVVVNTPAPKIPAPITNRAPSGFAPKTASNAEMIRARIAQAKARGELQGDVVQFGVQVLGMSLSLAKTYVRNNWDKA
jgi:SprT protein